MLNTLPMMGSATFSADPMNAVENEATLVVSRTDPLRGMFIVSTIPQPGRTGTKPLTTKARSHQGHKDDRFLSASSCHRVFVVKSLLNVQESHW
jgi:hypothetical protein